MDYQCLRAWKRRKLFLTKPVLATNPKFFEPLQIQTARSPNRLAAPESTDFNPILKFSSVEVIVSYNRFRYYTWVFRKGDSRCFLVEMKDISTAYEAENSWVKNTWKVRGVGTRLWWNFESSYIFLVTMFTFAYFATFGYPCFTQ